MDTDYIKDILQIDEATARLKEDHKKKMSELEEEYKKKLHAMEDTAQEAFTQKANEKTDEILHEVDRTVEGIEEEGRKKLQAMEQKYESLKESLTEEFLNRLVGGDL